MSNVAALRLQRWLDDPPGDFSVQDTADLEELLAEREEDIKVVSCVWNAAVHHASKELDYALADLFCQFSKRILIAESNGN